MNGFTLLLLCSLYYLGDFYTPQYEFQNIKLYGEEDSNINKEQPFVTISLGSNCSPAFNTRQSSIRTYAFPFDWCLTPYYALYTFIRNDFKDFFKQDHLVPSSKNYFSDYLNNFLAKQQVTTSSENRAWVLDKVSGIIYNHDFPQNSLEIINQHYAINYIKYMRRIQRLYDIAKSGKHIYFIRYYDITKQESFDLYNLLKEKFPDTSFTLIVIGNDKDEFDQDWNMSHIKNFYCIGQDNLFWYNLCKNIAASTL